MADFNLVTCGAIDVTGPLGGGLRIPPGLWEPGSASFWKGHFGFADTTPFIGALNVGPSLTGISNNTIGFEILTGIKNLFGVDTTIGSDISLGGLDVSYSAVGNSFNGLLVDIVPAYENVTPKESFTSLYGTLNGIWFYNGRLISTEPDVTSDIRLKKNIESFENGLDIILELNPVRFDWDENVCPTTFLQEYREPDDEYGYPGKIKRQYGLIAQEVEEIIPDVVGERKMYDETYKLIRYEKIVPILISAVQDQQKQIEDLKTEINSLKQEINSKKS